MFGPERSLISSSPRGTRTQAAVTATLLPPVIYICFLKNGCQPPLPFTQQPSPPTRGYLHRQAACRWYLGAGFIHKCMIVPTAAHRSPLLTGNLNQPIIPVGIHVTPAGGGSGLKWRRPLAHYCAYLQMPVGGAHIGVIKDLEIRGRIVVI